MIEIDDLVKTIINNFNERKLLRYAQTAQYGKFKKKILSQVDKDVFKVTELVFGKPISLSDPMFDYDLLEVSPFSSFKFSIDDASLQPKLKQIAKEILSESNGAPLLETNVYLKLLKYSAYTVTADFDEDLCLAYMCYVKAGVELERRL